MLIANWEFELSRGISIIIICGRLNINFIYVIVSSTVIFSKLHARLLELDMLADIEPELAQS